MKHFFSVLLQTILLFVVGFVVMLWHPIGLSHLLWQTATQRRTYEADWLIAAFAVYLVIILIEAARKHLRSGIVPATVALALATGLGLALGFGFKLTDLNHYGF